MVAPIVSAAGIVLAVVTVATHETLMEQTGVVLKFPSVELNNSTADWSSGIAVAVGV